MRLDPRAGSKELERPLRAAGLPVTLDTLPSGDVEIIGKGPGERPLMVGVEVKKVPDLLACVRNGRFAEQLRGMRSRYEVCWLLIEGEWRLGEDALEVREGRRWESRGHYTYQEVASWLLTIVQRAGVLLWRTTDQAESVTWLRALYWWWVSKDFEEHRAHLGWFIPPPTSEAAFEEPSLTQKVAAVLPGIGTNRAWHAAQAFESVRAMVLADERAWQQVDGVGKVTARKVVEAVNG